MTRILVTTTCLALALATAACAPPRRYHERTVYEERHSDRVDINSASARELSRLPGIDRDDADRIVANRPYRSPESLVDRGIIGPRTFDAIEDHVYAGRTRRERADDDRWDDRDERHQRFYDDH